MDLTDTSESLYILIFTDLPNMKKLLKSVSIYENTIGKDYGVPADDIDARKLINIK